MDIRYGILVAAVVLASCGDKDGKVKTRVEGVPFETIVADTTVQLVQEEGGPSANLHLSLAYATDPDAGALNDAIIHGGFLVPDYMALMSQGISMQQAADSFLLRYADDYRRTYGPLYRGDREHKESYNVKYDCKTTVESHRKGIITYVARSTMYGGGAHSVTSTVVRNLGTKTGKAVALQDVFSEKFERPLAELIVKQLCKQLKAADLSGLQEQGVFCGIEPYVTDNFILGDDEITFIYTDSEIAPHDMGELSVTLAEEDLKLMLK